MPTVERNSIGALPSIKLLDSVQGLSKEPNRIGGFRRSGITFVGGRLVQVNVNYGGSSGWIDLVNNLSGEVESWRLDEYAYELRIWLNTIRIQPTGLSTKTKLVTVSEGGLPVLHLYFHRPNSNKLSASFESRYKRVAQINLEKTQDMGQVRGFKSLDDGLEAMMRLRAALVDGITP
jgi:hypothetical protein